MAANKTQDQSAQPSPDRVQAASRPQPGHDVTVQTVMQVQKALREVTAQMDDLADDFEPIDRRLNAIENNIFFLKIGITAAVVLTVIATAIFWTVDHRLAALEAGLTSQAQSQVTSTEPPQQSGSTP